MVKSLGCFFPNEIDNNGRSMFTSIAERNRSILPIGRMAYPAGIASPDMALSGMLQGTETPTHLSTR